MTDGAGPARRTRAEQLVEDAINALRRAEQADRHATFEALARAVDDGTLGCEASIALQRTLRVVVVADVPVDPAIQGRALRKLEPGAASS